MKRNQRHRDTMKRIMRFIGNRSKPEKKPYASALGVRMERDEDKAYKKSVRKPRIRRVVRPAPTKPKPLEEPFETNLMEPLVGWKSWHIQKGRLASQVYAGVWYPEKPFQAVCRNAKCQHCPTTMCTCGIYAKNNFGQVIEFLEEGEACGVVLGWGRYIRGVDGWRSEYAYPARILIARDSLADLEKLKEYRVPLYVMEPMRLYDPMEDGYEYWNNEEDWSFGTSAESHAQEDSGQDNDQDA